MCRERASGVYGTPAYFTATVLFDLIPMRVLPPCVFAAATYWMIGFRPGFLHLCVFLLLLILTNMVCCSASSTLVFLCAHLFHSMVVAQLDTPLHFPAVTSID